MKKIVFLLSMILFIMPVSAETNLALNAKSSILLEYSTGTILYENNSHERLAPASMTKMMSMLIILESIDKEIITWDTMVTVSENASSMGGSQILLETGEQMSVRDLFKGVAIASGNDAVVALAEKIAGTTDLFVEMMNNKASELGLQDTNFQNPHGLDAVNHYSSAYDMAMIAKELLKHEEVLEYTSVYETYLRENTPKKVWLVNTNKLVRFYNGVDGLKTGYTSQSGYCLTATANIDNMRVIAVVMGEESSKVRNSEVSTMLDYAYAQYKLDRLYSKGDIIDNKKVYNSNIDKINLVLSEDVTFLKKKTDAKEEYTYEVLINDLVAPIKTSDKVGTLKIMKDNKVIKEVDLNVKNDVEKANIFTLFMNNLKDTLTFNIY